MRKLEPVVKQETLYIACWVAVFSVLMQAVLLVVAVWEWRMLIANLITGTAAVLNFLILGITVQNAVTKDEQDAKSTMRASMTFRNMAILIVVLVSYIALSIKGDLVLLATLVAPLLFPRVAIAMRPLFNKSMPTDEEVSDDD